MYADRSATDNHISGLCLVGSNVDTFGNDADTTCINEEFVTFASFYHLRVASDNLYACSFGCCFHRQDDTSEIHKRQSLFQYETGS